MSEVAITEVIAPPAPDLKGKFAIYTTPDGGMKIAYKLDGTDENKVITIPAAAMSMAKMMGGGPLAGMIGI